MPAITPTITSPPRRPQQTQPSAAGSTSPPGSGPVAPSPIDQPRRPADIVGETLLLRLADLPAGNPDRRRIRNRAVEHYLPYATHLARRYSNRGETLPDLIQVAALALINAVDRYDPVHGVAFTHFAGPTITGELKHYFRDKLSAVRVPRRIQENRLAIREATATLTQLLSRLPTAADLATHLSISETEVTAALLAGEMFRPLSLTAPAGDPDARGELGDILGNLDAAIAAIAGVDNRETLRPILATLPHREQAILAMRFSGNMTQSEIATTLDLSQMHISRLLAGCLTQLRTAMAATDPSGG